MTDIFRELEDFREEVRRFVVREYDPAAAEGQFPAAETPAKARFVAKLAARRWIGIDWPVEYGGGGRDGAHRIVLQDELDYAGLPSLSVELSVGATILRVGPEALRRELLPLIAGGQLSVALGLSEPDAGSDLAAVATRAVVTDDHFVVDGRKMWTSAAHFADVIWLLCSTDPHAARHEGLSILVVDARSPGIEVLPIHTMGDHRTNLVFLTAVKVPASRLVGELHQGWRYLESTLDAERFSHPFGSLQRNFDEFVSWARVGGGWRSAALGRTAALLSLRVEAARSHMNRALSRLSQGHASSTDATMLKVAMTETLQDVGETVIDAIGVPALQHSTVAGAPMGGRYELLWRDAIIRTIAGGANELMRTRLARDHLGLPSARPTHQQP